MDMPLPRIRSVSAEAPSALRVIWNDGTADRIELAGWIATGDGLLDALRRPEVFAGARVGEYEAAIIWDEDGDLSIDAVHLHSLAEEQRPFTADAIACWQSKLRLSNAEAADLLHVSASQWQAYKAGSTPVPAPIGMLCRAIWRDPLLMHAHYRPQMGGRSQAAGE